MYICCVVLLPGRDLVYPSPPSVVCRNPPVLWEMNGITGRPTYYVLWYNDWRTPCVYNPVIISIEETG